MGERRKDERVAYIFYFFFLSMSKEKKMRCGAFLRPFGWTKMKKKKNLTIWELELNEETEKISSWQKNRCRLIYLHKSTKSLFDIMEGKISLFFFFLIEKFSVYCPGTTHSIPTKLIFSTSTEKAGRRFYFSFSTDSYCKKSPVHIPICIYMIAKQKKIRGKTKYVKHTYWLKS